MYIGNDLQIAHPSYKIIDDISSGFNGSTTSFALQVSGETPVPFPISTQQVMISVNGVVQEPDPSGSAGFKLLGSNIVFSSAPANGHAFFGVINAGADYVTAGSEFPDGSVTAPSFTFQDDQDTGWYRAGSGSVSYSANGVQKVNFDGNGLTVTGTATATTFSGSGASLTHLNLGDSNNTGTVATARLGSGTASSSTYLRGDGSWQAITGTTINNNANNRIITGSGTANTLEAESGLTWDGTNLDVGDNKKFRLGDSNEAEIYYDSSSNLLLKSNHYVRVASDAGLWVWDGSQGNWIAGFDPGGSCKLRDSGYTTRLETTTSGVTITGTCTATTFSGSGASLTSLPAANITGTLPSISGANLTSVNATTLDSIDSGSFLRSDADDTATGVLTLTSSSNYPLTINSSQNGKIKLSGSTSPFIRFQESTTDKAFIQWNTDGYLVIKNEEDSATLRLRDDFTMSWDDSTHYTVLHQGNLGSSGALASSDVYLSNLYASDWIRVSSADKGIYNSTNSNYLYSDDAQYWTVAYYGSAGGLRIRDGFNGTIRGAVDANDSNDIGFTDNNSSWAIKTNRGTNQCYLYDQHFFTDTNNTYDLGSSSTRWRNGYFGTKVYDGNGDLRKIPYQGGYSSVTLAASHAGQVLDIQSSTTVPSGTFAAGDAVTIVNDGSSDCTITQGSGLTMYNAADASTGNRTLASKGMCTIWFKSASTCFISGGGLS